MAAPLKKETYDLLATYYRSHPGDCAGGAKTAGVAWKTALRVWQGPVWKGHPELEPMKNVLNREANERAARVADEENRVRQAALKKQQQAIALAEEAETVNSQLTRIARGDVLSGLANLGRMTEGIAMLAERMNDMLKRGTKKVADPANPGAMVEVQLDLQPREVMGVIRSYSSSTRSLVLAAEALVQLERTRANMPSVIVGLQATNLSLEDAEQQVEVATKALAKARQLGLVVLKGGAVKTG